MARTKEEIHADWVANGSKDYRRKGPLPPNHPLAGGRTIIYSMHRPNQQQVPQKSTTTIEEKIQISAGFEVNRALDYQMKNGLPVWTKEQKKEFYEYQLTVYEKFYKGESNGQNETGSGETGKEEL